MKHYSILLLLAIIALKNLRVIQLDIKTAFLYGDLQEEIYMNQPEILLLEKRIMYPDCWNRFMASSKSHAVGTAISTKPFSYQDSVCACRHTCVYYQFTAKGEYTIMVIYVDDWLVSSNIPNQNNWVSKNSLQSAFFTCQPVCGT